MTASDVIVRASAAHDNFVNPVASPELNGTTFRETLEVKSPQLIGMDDGYIGGNMMWKA